MNEFEITWEPLAENQLAAAWLSAQDREAVTSAQATIDHLLATGPLEHAEHLSEGLFALRVLPLHVFFAINEAECKVWVKAARLGQTR